MLPVKSPNRSVTEPYNFAIFLLVAFDQSIITQTNSRGNHRGCCSHVIGGMVTVPCPTKSQKIRINHWGRECGIIVEKTCAGVN